MSNGIKFYKGRVCLNFLSNSIDNALECMEACDYHGLVGVLSAHYENNTEAYQEMRDYQEALKNAFSIGLGAGNPNQSDMVAHLSHQLHPQHANQVFTGVGKTRGVDGKETFINALVSPTGVPGWVNIATGPLSSKEAPTKVSIETAIEMVKDMGGDSIKFYPMNGLDCIEEYTAVAKACAAHDFNLEPTGGIDLENFEDILTIALDAGVKKIIPHVYSSIINNDTKETNPKDVKTLFEIVKRCVL